MTDVNLYTAMAEGKPYKSYIKTIFGKVFVVTLSPEDEKTREGHLLKGNPNKKIDGVPADSCIVDVWNEKQNQVFKLLNRPHLESGRLIEYKRKDTEEAVERVRTVSEWTDEELLAGVLKAHFKSFEATINKLEEIATLYRLYNLGQENGISSKLVDRIVARISEVQGYAFTPTEE